MANGRVLPSAILFDTLLARAWRMGLDSYAQAQNIEAPDLQIQPVAVDGAYALPDYQNGFDARQIEGHIAQHDIALQQQLNVVGDEWSREFQSIMLVVAPVDSGFAQGLQWLQSASSTGDGLGYLGVDHRMTHIQSHVAQIASGLNERGLPMPAGASAALGSIAHGITSTFEARAQAQMQADRAAQARKLTLDTVEMIIRLRNEALSATMDYVFSQMHMMFDVFGRNNDYLTGLQRKEQTLRASMTSSGAALAQWDAKAMQAHDATQAQLRTAKARNDRKLDISGLTVDQHIKRLRRYSQRAASALNSVGVSVNSTASESNSVDAEE